MSTFSAQMESFLKGSTGFVNRSLTEAVIKQMGGESVFIQHHADIVKHGMGGGFSGFISYHETVGFFSENHSDIKEYFDNIADCIGVGSFMDVLLENEKMKTELDLTNGEVAEAFFGETTDAQNSSEDRIKLGNWIAWCVAADAAGAYADFLYSMEHDEDYSEDDDDVLVVPNLTGFVKQQ